MMVWLRLLIFLAPAGVIAAFFWLASQARDLVYRTDSELVVAVRAAPRAGNPLAPSTGATREISELIFDRLLSVDDEGRPIPHLATRWGYRHRATVFFPTAAAAADAEATLAAAKSCWVDWQLAEAKGEGDRLHLVTTDPRPGWPEVVLATLDRSGFLHPRLVRLTLKEAVQQSLEDFLSTAVEKSHVRQLRYRDGRTAEIFLSPDGADAFLKELSLYYDSNRDLAPEIDDAGEAFGYADLDFEIELRPDVRWHDGETLTAGDLMFTFAEITRPGSPWPLRGAFDFADRMEKVDERTVRVRCREYFAPALESWAKLPLLPEHRLRSAASPADWEAFFARPIGSGPYRWESTWPDGSIVLGAHRAYFSGEPLQAAIRYRVLPEPGMRLRELKLGAIDLFQPDERERRWAAKTCRATVIEDTARYHSFVAWNVNRHLFRDAAVRRALAQAVDLDALLPTIASGHAEPWPGLFFPGSWFAPASPPKLGYDPAASDRALNAAGWSRNEKTRVWLDEKGNGIAFSLAYDAADPLHAELAAALGSAWKAAGIAARLEPVDWRELVEKRLAPRAYDAMLLGWEIDSSRDRWGVLHSSEAGAGGTNFSGLKDGRMDDLLDQLRRTDDPAVVASAAAALQSRVFELQPCFFLCGTGRALALRQGAVRMARPTGPGAWSDEPVTVDQAGLPASRPWWVRTDGMRKLEP